MLQGDCDFLRSSSRVILEEAHLLEDEGALGGAGGVSQSRISNLIYLFFMARRKLLSPQLYHKHAADGDFLGCPEPRLPQLGCVPYGVGHAA